MPQNRILIAGAVILVIIAGLSLAVKNLADDDALAIRIADALSESTGLSIEFEGSVELLSVFPKIRLNIPSMRASGFVANGQQINAQLKDVIVETPLFAALKKTYDNTEIDIADLQAFIESNTTDEPKDGHVDERTDEQVGEDNLTAPAHFIESLSSLLVTAKELRKVTIRIFDMGIAVQSPDNQTRRWRAAPITAELNAHNGKVTLGSFSTSTQQEMLVIDNEVSFIWSLSDDGGNNSMNMTVDLADTRLTARVQSNESTATLEQFTIVGPFAELEFDGLANLDQNRATVEGKIFVKETDLSAWPARLVHLINPERSDKLFDYTPLQAGIPSWLSTEVDLVFDGVSLGESDILNGELRAVTADKTLSITTDTLSIFGGKTNARIVLDTQRAFDIRLNASVEAYDMELERLRLEDGLEQVLTQGLVDLSIKLKGRGPSTAHLAASLNGFVQASADGVIINRQYSTALDRGIVSWALEQLSVTSSRVTEDDTGARLIDPLAVECASLRMFINNGRAEMPNGLVIELLDNTLFGSGYVDLKDETLGVAFRTRRKSLFDWSAISIVRYVEIGGTANQPSVQMNRYELARQGVLTASSVAWGPLPSIVYKLAESGLNNRAVRPCFRSIN